MRVGARAELCLGGRERGTSMGTHAERRSVWLTEPNGLCLATACAWESAEPLKQNGRPREAIWRLRERNAAPGSPSASWEGLGQRVQIRLWVQIR